MKTATLLAHLRSMPVPNKDGLSELICMIVYYVIIDSLSLSTRETKQQVMSMIMVPSHLAPVS